MKKILFIKAGLATGGTTSSFLSMLNMMKEQSQFEIYVWVSLSEDMSRLPEYVKIYRNEQMEDAYRRPSSSVQKLFDLIKSGSLFMYLESKIIRRKNSNSRKLLPIYQAMDLRRAKKCRKIDLSMFDLVVTWEELFPFYHLSEAITCKRKIGWIHPDYKQCGFEARIDLNTIKKMDAVVAVSNASKLTLQEEFPEVASKFWNIPNRLNVEDIHKRMLMDVPTIKTSDSEVVLLSVGRLQNISKAYDRAIRIAKKLKESGLKFKWYIVGDGEDCFSLEELILNSELVDIVILLGEQKNPYPYMKQADLFVMQSYYEGRPMVVDEALIVGTPILATNYKSAREQVSDEYGWVVNNDEVSIYNMLKDLILCTDKIQAKKANLQKMDTSKYSAPEQYLKLFEEVIG